MTLKTDNKMNNPDISVIMPVHNYATYLPAAIESVLNQTYDNFEIIIIDDGSTDNSLEVMHSYSDPRLRLFSNKKNKGISLTLNYGLAAAKGRYIARMDADDMSVPTRFATQLAFLEENKEYGMVGSFGNRITADGEWESLLEFPVDHDDIAFEMIFGCQFIHSAVMMRKGLVKKLKYDAVMQNAEDYELWFRMMDQALVYNLPIPLVNIRKHDSNVSGKVNRITYDTHIRIYEILFGALEIPASYDDLFAHCSIAMYFWSTYYDAPEKLPLVASWLNKLIGNEGLRKWYNPEKVDRRLKAIWKSVALGDEHMAGGEWAKVYDSYPLLK
jgi:glycosyltransferase involved in cell wall biosynthesis